MREDYDFSVHGEDELSLHEWREMHGLPDAPGKGAGCEQPDSVLLNAPFVALTEPEKQNAQFTEIVRAFKGYYKKKSQSNHCYKLAFFIAVMLILLMVTVGFVVACVHLLRHPAQWQSSIAVAAGSAVTLITALLKLPEIIATHLFPVEEDRVIVDLVNALKDAPSFSPSFSEEKEAKRL